MNIEIFKKEEFGEVRAITIEGEPFFIASDIARALGYKDPKDAIATYCKSGKVAKCTDVKEHGYEIKKIFDANYGEVNVYHKNVFKILYNK